MLALTMGEPAGIGGEIALKAWLSRRNGGVPPFVLLDDPDRLSRLADGLNWPVPVEVVSDLDAVADVFDHAVPVLPIGRRITSEPGRPKPSDTQAVVESIDRAVALALDGRVEAVVTNPIHKSMLYSAGFPYPGHTEFLAARTGSSDKPVMMLQAKDLRAVPVTIHMPLKDAIAALTADRIVCCGQVTHRSLIADFGVAAPRIAVAALNPHGGEEGTLGTEEMDVIAPAIRALQREGINAFGPLPADSLFHPAARAQYDAVLCMYHDQALIPIKTVDFDGGVNITLGLPIIRTSPDHGTALGIAGTGRASPHSLIAALRRAAELAVHRGRVGTEA